MPMSDEEFQSVLNRLNSGKANEAYQSAQGNIPVFPEPKRLQAPGQMKQPMSVQEFEDKLRMSKPELFNSQYAGLPPEQADAMIMSGQQPERQVASLPEMPAEQPSSPTQAIQEQPLQEAPKQPQEPIAPVPQSSPESSSKQSALRENPLEDPQLNDNAIRKAQDNADVRRLGLSVGEGLTRYAATAGGGKFDDSQFREMNKNADSNVKDIQDRRDAVTKNMTMANTLVDLATKNMTFDRAQRLNDPNSSESKAIRAMVLKYEPKLANDPNFEQMSGQDTKDFLMHFLEVKGKQEDSIAKDEAKEDRKENREIAKDERKEDRDVKKENRKVRLELNTAETALTGQIKQLEETKKMFDNYSKSSMTGTGPLATLGGATKYLSQGTEAMDSTFKKLKMDELVKMFQGMSKAIDSNAERAAFEATQPGITLDDKTNALLLDRKIEAAKSLLNKTKAAKGQFDRTGSFEYDEEPSSQQAPSNQSVQSGQPAQSDQSSEMVSVVSPEGKPGSIPRANLEKALKRGFKEVQ